MSTTEKKPKPRRRKLPPKTILNPEFMESEEVRDAVEEAITQMHMGLATLTRGTDHRANPFALVDGMYSEIWSALPERGGCEVPEDGAWILVKRVPHTELDDRFEVPLYSLWRARPDYTYREIRLGARRTKVRWPFLKAVINTPGGELWLYPGEYSTVPSDRLGLYLDEIGRGVSVHFLGAGEPGDFADQLFYLMSHGIRRSEALLLLLPNLQDQNFCYFTVEL